MSIGASGCPLAAIARADETPMRVIRTSAESDEISRSGQEHADAIERLAGDGLYRLRRHLARHAGTAAAGHAVQAGRLDATEEELSPKRRPGIQSGRVSLTASSSGCWQ